VTDLNTLSTEELLAMRQRAVKAQSVDPDLVRTVWGEARGEAPEGRQAVAAVARNRAKATGRPIGEIVRMPGQFEPWEDPVLRKQMDALDPSSPEYQQIAQDIADDSNDGEFDHFYSPAGQKAKGRQPPKFDNGSGVDIGGNRFFKLGYAIDDNAPAPPAEEEPDLNSMSTEDLIALRQRQALKEQGMDYEDIHEPPPYPSIATAPLVDRPTSAMRPDTSPLLKRSPFTIRDDSKSDVDLNYMQNPKQVATYEAEIKAGRIKPEEVRGRTVRSGDRSNPFVQMDPRDIPPPGDWYVDTEGVIKQVPPDPWIDTAKSAALDIGTSINPVSGALKGFIPGLEEETDDPRYQAMKRAAQSGLLFGGRNELVSAGAAIPGLIEGGLPEMKKRFGDTLQQEDYKSGVARRNFPIAYDASAVAGAIPSAIVMPEGLVPRLAAAGAGGFLATDGGLKERAIGAGLGMAGGEVINKVAPALIGALANKIGVPRAVTPEVAAEAEAALRDLGVDPTNVPPLMRAKIDSELQRGAEPRQAAMVALNEGLDVPIPLRKGDITQNPVDQLNFNLTLRGARGGAENAQAAQDIVASQQAAIRANVDRIGDEIGGPVVSNGVPSRGTGARGISEDLNAMKDKMKGDVDAAYDAARAGGEGVKIPQEHLPILAARTRDAVQGFIPEKIPHVLKILDGLDTGQAGVGGRTGAYSGSTDVNQLFAKRELLSSLRSDSSNPYEAVAAGKAVEQIDSFVQQVVSEGLLSGDKSAVKAYVDAIAKHKEYAGIFKQGDAVEKLTQKTGSGDARQLAVDPEEAANYILGRSDMGMVGKRNLYRDLSKIRDLVGKDSDSWNQIRAEMFLRMTNSGEGPMEGGVRQFSGANFAKTWQDANKNDSRLINMVFSPEERAKIDAFAGAAARVTSSVKGGDNSANTAVAMKYLKRLYGTSFAVGKVIPVLGWSLEKIEEMAQHQAGRAALKPGKATPRLVPLKQIPSRLGGYFGAEVAEPEPL
jgi:hypothetical protein